MSVFCTLSVLGWEGGGKRRHVIFYELTTSEIHANVRNNNM